MDANSVGRTVRWARKRAGLTQHELAQAVGMPQSTIARIEAGAVIPRAETLFALLRLTGHQVAVEPLDPELDREAIRRRLATPVSRRARKALGRRAKDPLRSPLRILRRLRGKGVPFVLTGDVAEVAHGSSGPVGRAIEVCIAPTEVAHERLTAALDDLGPLAAGGRLRVVTHTDAGAGYDLLLPTAVNLRVAVGISMRVAALEDLVRARRARGTAKDLEAAAELTAIAGEGR